MERATAAHCQLVEFLRDLDVLILDTQYTAAEYAQRVGWGHGCLSKSVRLAIEASVGRLILFHHDPSHDDEQIDEMVEIARTLAAGSSVIVDAAAENGALTVGLTSARAPGIHGPASFPIDIALAPALSAFETAHGSDKSVILSGETTQTAFGLL
jgi:hypothetical protein